MVVTALRTRPRSLGDLLQAGLSDPDRVQRLIYALALTHHLDQGQGHPPLDVVPTPSRTAAASQRGGALGQAPPSHPPSHLDSRPPRALQRSDLGPSSAPAPAADRDAVPYSAGPRSRTDAPGGSPSLQEAADAAFHAAQQRAGRRQYAEAARLAREASEADPGNAEYLALHAWLRAQLGELSNPSAAEHILAALDRAVLKQRTNPRIRFLRGQVLKRVGREEDAFKDFRFVVRSEPSHIDAAREVRLYQLRQHKAQKKSGVFSKLFLR
jgi:tetratricopeptide (TPR) repeat protein